MKMKAFVVFFILTHVSQHASSVLVLEGMESVWLPCQVSGLPKNTKVVWSRFDLNPSTIHQLQDKYEPYVQNQQYSSRTSMSADALKTGDLSLTLKKPHHSDSSIYTCTIHNDKSEIGRQTVWLQVIELPTFPAGAFAVLAVVFAAGLAVYFWYNTIPVSQVEVEEGVWLVKLPCKTKVQLPDCVVVEWSRCAPKPMMIHSYQNGSDLHVGQDEFYCDRTKMEKEPLKTGDLSLTLREPWSRDSATYICTVHSHTKVWMQKVVHLTVKPVVKVVEVRECAKSVTLTFRPHVKLPGDATVEWCRMDTGTLVAANLNQPGKKKNSYRGQLNKNLLQTGDLSLTLIKPTQADSAIYLCTVCGYGDVLLQRFVHLNVQGKGF